MPKRKLEASEVKLSEYLPVVGYSYTNVQVSYEGQSATLPLVVVKGKGHTLLEKFVA